MPRSEPEERLRAGLRTPDTMERSWPELASSRRNFLPLLGEREGVRADVSVHHYFHKRPFQGAESGVLSLADRSGAPFTSAFPISLWHSAFSLRTFRPGLSSECLFGSCRG